MGVCDRISTADSLPPNLLELTVGCAAAASLLPLTRLKQLALHGLGGDAMPAAELRQLSALTSLTSVDLMYENIIPEVQEIDAAADSWCALPVQHLSLWTSNSDSLQRNTLMQLSKLTRLASLHLLNCVPTDTIQPEMLGDVLAQLTRLRDLRLTREGAHGWVQLASEREQPLRQLAETAGAAGAAAGTAEDAAAGSFLKRTLHRLAGSLHKMQLSTLNLQGQFIDRAEAAALAEMKGLTTLSVYACDVEDCSVVHIASALHDTLRVLDARKNPRVTDGCLPVLARLAPGIGTIHLEGTGVTSAGLQTYRASIEACQAGCSSSRSTPVEG
jgi:hypothetical protein